MQPHVDGPAPVLVDEAEEIAAEANKNNPIELSAIDFDLWVLQYACDSRVVATGKARDEVK